MRNTILTPNALAALNTEARGVVLIMIETGARPSEICNLKPENIHLNTKVPYIEIHGKSDREVKASASNREIPLVGVSLEAMKANSNGFPRYFDKDTHLSNTLMKYFKENNLLETPAHKIYSIRHSFEDRMLEAGLDYALRCTLMGHKNNRPSYGDGGSMEYRRDQLLKIAHPVPREVIV
jgi:integrase